MQHLTLRILALLSLVAAVSACQTIGRFTETYQSIEAADAHFVAPPGWEDQVEQRTAQVNGTSHREFTRFRNIDTRTEVWVGQLTHGRVWSARQAGADVIKQMHFLPSLRNADIQLGERQTIEGGIGRTQIWPMTVDLGKHRHCFAFIDHWGAGGLPSNFRNKIIGYVCASRSVDARNRIFEMLSSYDVQPRFYSGEGLEPAS